MGYETRVHDGLSRALDGAITSQSEVAEARFVFVSDLHRGVRDGADDFQRCEVAYNAALGYYVAAGYCLVVLGDAEELWECSAEKVVREYRESLELEFEFLRDKRYWRISGNHDDLWEDPRNVRKLLQPLAGNATLVVWPALRVILTQEGRHALDILAVHGHQGSLFSDRLRVLAQPVVHHVWRRVQRVLKVSLDTPARDFELQLRHNRAMYDWARHMSGLVLIAGHTHKPVFTMPPEKTQGTVGQGPPSPDERDRALARAQDEWTKTLSRIPIQGRSAAEKGLKPCYFNTGCCCFCDRDITALEIGDGELRLVRWPDDDRRPRRKVLRRVTLEALVAANAAL